MMPDYKLENEISSNLLVMRNSTHSTTANQQIKEAENILNESIEDIKRDLAEYPCDRPLIDNLMRIASILEKFDPNEFPQSTFEEFPTNVLELLDKYVDDFDICGILYQCIGSLIKIPEIKSLFIAENIIDICQILLTHEDTKIAEESLHILSEVIEFSILNNYQPRETLIKDIILCFTLSYQSELYASQIFCSIAEFAPSPFILNADFSNIFKHLYVSFSEKIKKCIDKEQYTMEFQSDFDSVLNAVRHYQIRDEIRKNIVKMIYFIMKKDFSFYFGYKECFKYLFKSTNFMSSTLTNPDLLKFIFEIMVIIINNDEKEANEMVRLFAIRLKILFEDDYLPVDEEEDESLTEVDYSYDFYFFFLQNSEYCVVEPLIHIINFALTHLHSSFYDYCVKDNKIISLFFDYFKQGTYYIKFRILKYISLMVTHPEPGPTINYLMPSEDVIKGNFLQLCSFVFNSDDYDAILTFHEIVDKMIDYIMNHEPIRVCSIVSFILDDENLFENMTHTQEMVANGRITGDQYEKEREEKIAFLNNKIVTFCTHYREDQEAGLTPDVNQEE